MHKLSFFFSCFSTSTSTSTFKHRLGVIGLGVTEAGLSSCDTQVMRDFYQILKLVQGYMQSGDWESPPTNNGKICVLDMDNVPNNGSVVQEHMMELAQREETEHDDHNNNNDNNAMTEFLKSKVVFFNTMVDRITSQREGSNGMIPRCEPIPSKALVISDPKDDLPKQFHELRQYGVVIRRDPQLIDGDIALKLRVANATHTAIAHVMALVKMTNTDALAAANNNSNNNDNIDNDNNAGAGTNSSENTTLTAKVFMAYLDALVEHQILPSSFPGLGSHCPETQAAYDDWRPRLTHAHFGLSSFFITQNGAAKGGIRLGPTVVDLLKSENKPLTVTTAYAFAVLLRWLTPKTNVGHKDGVFTGWLAGTDRGSNNAEATNKSDSDTVSYADGLHHNLTEGWYQFRCACQIHLEGEPADNKRPVSEFLGDLTTPCQPRAYLDVIRAYLLAPDGGNLGQVAKKPAFETFVKAIATLYARMIAGDNLVEMLEEMKEASGPYAPKGMATSCDALVDDGNLSNGRPLFFRPSPIPSSSQLLKVPVDANAASAVVVSEVASTIVIDLHTHLLPPSHGSLCLWGFDELLTYVSSTSLLLID